MKNKVIVCVLCLVVVIAVAAYLWGHWNLGDVSISIKDGTLTECGAAIVIRNISGNALQYADTFGLEVYANGEWRSVETDIPGFSDCVSYYISPKEMREHTVNWEYRYGELAPGKYRVVKTFTVLDSNGEMVKDEQQKIYAYAEFRIWF